MKTCFNNAFTGRGVVSTRSRACRGAASREAWVLVTLIAGLGFILAERLAAQTFVTLHSFAEGGSTPAGCLTNAEGAYPRAGLVLSGNTLYGTASGGGSGVSGLYPDCGGYGTVFAVNIDGTGFTTLHTFNGDDGARPYAGLIMSSDTLYGTTTGLGNGIQVGTVFAVSADGTAFTTVYDFAAANGTNGCIPAELMQSGDTLYGTAADCGSSGSGTVFKVNTDGTGPTALHRFTATNPNNGVNSDGAYPAGPLALSGSTLYGAAWGGGSWGNGTVFKITTNGSGFAVVHRFTALNNSTNADGASPYGGVVLYGNTLYGTAYGGGSSGSGTVFKINTDGSGFSTLHSFTAPTGQNSDGYPVNSDGVYPYGGLILSGTTLYGTVEHGGSAGNGTVFAVNTNGTGFTTLHSFTASSTNSSGLYTNSDGAYPLAGVILSGNTLYGTTFGGGSSGYGTVFSLVIPPQLTITTSATNAILTWPTNATGFTLQSSTNLVPSPVWTTNSPAPVVVNGQNTVTTPISGTQQFYRLSQ